MALGKRQPKQIELFVPADQIRKGSGHPFYNQLNQVLEEGGFDSFLEELCAPYYKRGGRPGIPPGVYFRMLFIGYFEGLDSQRGIAWRCADSLALREFLGYAITEATPVHASMTIIRQRLPQQVFDEVFTFVLRLLQEADLLHGKAFGIDATTLEANAAMKSIVRRDNGEDWKEYLRGLATAEGIADPSDEDLRRLDRRRKGKKVSNKEWHSATDPDARITKMKDGRTHLAYKAEHTVQLESQAIVSAHVTHADKSDGESAPESLILAQAQLIAADHPQAIEEAVMDKGYHVNGLLAQCQSWGVRTYIPERKQKKRIWKDKPPEYETAFRGNRRRMRGAKGKALNRQRSERVERTFAQVCDTGGSRRTQLRGLDNVSKIHPLKCAGYNLGLLMRRVFGLRKPRNADAGRWTLGSNGFILVLLARVNASWDRWPSIRIKNIRRVIFGNSSTPNPMLNFLNSSMAPFLTGCYGEHPFGAGCLLARRLIERGCRFVEVDLGGWDTHTDNHKGVAGKSAILDQTLSQLLEDLDSRGLLQRTLVVVGTEFGRSPKIDQYAGRNHHPLGYTCLFAGGGAIGGAIHGRTEPGGRDVAENPVSALDFNATIANALGLNLLNFEAPFDGGQLFSISGKKTGQKGKPLAKLFS